MAGVMRRGLILILVSALASTAWAEPQGKPAERGAGRGNRAVHWTAMKRQLDPKKVTVIFSDHDDTLVPSWKLTKAAAANMSPSVKSNLTKVGRRKDTRFIVNSGSPLHRLEAFYAGVDADLIGNFGMQSRIGGVMEEDPIASAARPAVTEVGDSAEELAVKLGIAPDVVRRKGTSLSFHQAHIGDQLWVKYRTGLLEIIAKEPKLEAHVKGESVEVVPKGSGNKRVSMINWLTKNFGPDWKNRVNLVYAGDSGGKGGGDEPAFKFVTEHGGFGILVRHGTEHDPNTTARHYARDMADVENMLRWLGNRRGAR
jgi:trehalose-6-phosphatase